MPFEDSRSIDHVIGKRPYVNSKQPGDAWGQAPASYFILEIIGTLLIGEPISGYYVSTSSSDFDLFSHQPQDLQDEINRWEALGLEDWFNSENDLP